MWCKNYVINLLSAVLCSVALSSCVSPQAQHAGDVVDTPNEVVGFVLDSSGVPAPHVRVQLHSTSFDPLKISSASDSLVGMTDSTGHYSISNIGQGLYSLEAKSIVNGLRALITKIDIGTADSINVRTTIINKPAAIKVAIPSGLDATNGYLYIPGSSIYSLLRGYDGYVQLDSVPTGSPISIYYGVLNSSETPRLIRDSISVIPGGETKIDYGAWKYSKNLKLNTTASGAAVTGTVTDFPILIRLTKEHFDFDQAKNNGEDLRIANKNGTLFPYEIERWDAVAQAAEIWVKVDTVRGNDSAQFVTLYWGNAAATGLSNSEMVFDTSKGFQGVWHMGETAGGVAADATPNHFEGTPADPSSITPVEGIIGSAQRFNGLSGYIDMQGTASGPLNFPRNGTYAISAWANIDTLDGQYRTIVSKGDFQYNLEVVQDNSWEFAEFNQGTGWEMTSLPANSKTWMYLMGVRAGTREYLYVNGSLADSTIWVSVDTTNLRTSNFDFMIGRIFKSATDPKAYFFDGMIDEVRVMNKEPGTDWIKLCYMNQNVPDKLVHW